MVRLTRFTAIAVLLIGAVAVSACTPRVTSSGGQKPATRSIPAGGFDPSKPVRVAILAPLTASNAGAAGLGNALVNAARMGAVDLKDQLLDLKVYDTKGDANVASQAVQQALGEGAKLIIGPLFGANTQAISSFAQARGVKVLSFSTDSTVAGGSVYLTGFLPEMGAKRITTFARSRGYNALGIFYPRTAYGAAVFNGASKASNGLVAVTEYERTNDGIPRAATIFARDVKNAGARALILADSGQALKYVGTLLANEGLTEPSYKMLGLGEWNARATLQEASLRGGWFPAPDPGAMRTFVSKYRKSFGSVPPSLAVLGYDAVQIAGQMLVNARSSGSNDPFSAAALTRPQGFRGAVGPIRFTPDGLGERGMAILEVGEGTFGTIDPAPVAFGAGS